MISEKLYEKIRKEGLKEGYKFGNCGGEYDDNGDFVFVIRLLPTRNKLAEITEPTFNGKRIDPDAIKHLTS